jgi:hypothetical protein
MNKTGPKRFVLISAAVIFSMIISVNTASPSSSRDADKYVYPKLAADGISSDDVALAAAAAACNAAGTKLILPAGQILLTGAATVTLDNCAMVGVGAPAGDNSGNYGTTILLTSEDAPPFRLETGWQISGINFYWPNQTSGATRYPPLFSDGGKNKGFNHGVINNIVIISSTPTMV